ncbi:protein NRT1/ PTR FAMILY 8.3 [Rosa sericea]
MIYCRFVLQKAGSIGRFTSPTSVRDFHTMPRILAIVRDWFQNYRYFSRATICIQGLVFSHSFATHAIVSILITYLTTMWKYPHAQIAVVVMNVQDGVLDIMVIILAHIPRTYIGLFRVIATTNASYIIGLLLLWLSAEYMSEGTASRVFYGAMVLITLGEAGRWAALREFLDEQYSREQNHAERTYDENKDKKDALWMLPWFLGAVIPPFLFKTTWQQIFMISTIAMGVSYLGFLLGFPYYFTYNMTNTEQGQDARPEEVNHLEQAPRVPEQTRSGNVWRLINILRKDERFLIEALAIWLAFLLAYSVVKAAGSTFFFQQMDNLDNPFDNYDPAVYFNVFASFSKYLISFLWNLIPRKWKPSRLRIWCGMACVVLCCLVASQVESHRLNTTSNRSIFWLVPQFFLLGVMEGLAMFGMIDFLVDRVSEGDKVMVAYYGSHTTVLIIGIGKILVGLSVLAFRGSWFDDNDLDTSHLDKYYRALTILTSVVFFFHCCIAFYYYTREELQDETPSSVTIEMVNQNQPQIDPSPHNPDNAFTETLDDRVGLSYLLGQFVGQ